jgi:RimJ/RimL family protein N-acetyltransferase
MKSPSILKGKKVYLSPVSREDLGYFYNWLNNLDDVSQYLITPTFIPITQKDLEDWYEKLSSDYFKRVFTIHDIATDKPIGRIDIEEINLFYRTASLLVFVGDKKFRGKGCGSEAISLVLDFGFNILGLNNIAVEIYSFNDRSLNVFKKLGFEKIGVRHKACFYNGKFHDIILMEILSDVWNNR